MAGATKSNLVPVSLEDKTPIRYCGQEADKKPLPGASQMLGVI